MSEKPWGAIASFLSLCCRNASIEHVWTSRLNLCPTLSAGVKRSPTAVPSLIGRFDDENEHFSYVVVDTFDFRCSRSRTGLFEGDPSLPGWARYAGKWETVKLGSSIHRHEAGVFRGLRAWRTICLGNPIVRMVGRAEVYGRSPPRAVSRCSVLWGDVVRTASPLFLKKRGGLDWLPRRPLSGRGASVGTPDKSGSNVDQRGCAESVCGTSGTAHRFGRTRRNDLGTPHPDRPHQRRPL